MGRRKANQPQAGTVVNVLPGQGADDERDDVLDLGLGGESADDHDFDSFVQELSADQGTIYESKVYRQPQGHGRENEFLFAFKPGELTFTGLQLKVRSEYGPGRYFCRTYVSGVDPATQRPYTQLVKGGTFKFAIGAQLGAAGPAGGFNPLAIAGGDPASMKFLEKMFAERSKPALVNGLDPTMIMFLTMQESQSKLMLGMMGLMMNRSAGDNGRDSIDQAMRLLALRDKMNGDDEPEDTLGRVLTSAERVLPALFNAIGSTYGARRPIAAPATIPLGNDGAKPLDPKLLHLLQSQADAIGKLPQAFAFGVTDDSLIDAMIEPIETDEQLQALRAIAEHPQLIEALVVTVPALEAHAARLITFVAALKAELPSIEIGEAEGDEPAGGDALHTG